MKIIRKVKEMVDFSNHMRFRGKTIGFVPTMGALHAGHMSLIRQASKDVDIVVVSIFVNPAQFGPKEDFKKYPRRIKEDIALCRAAGVDIIFTPTPEEMYPKGHLTYVTAEKLSDCLCGKFRPGHFKGVATIVCKLFNIVSPTHAYSARKMPSRW